jgi:type IV secretory pathway ATPase VirB11/archaellum biosynthesis ATPase
MDIHLDTLLRLPNVSVFTCYQEEYIYERVKELTVEQVSQNEDLSPERVASIFKRIAQRKKKTGDCQSV